MKRYLLFGFDWYYPAGGKQQVVGDFESLDECTEVMKNGIKEDTYTYHTPYTYDNYDVLDLVSHQWTELQRR